MRSISAALLAACKSLSAVPYITATAKNQIGAVRRHDFTTLDSTANASGDHDACVPADGSVIRVRMEGGNVRFQRVTTPATGPWTAWSNLDTGRGVRVACSAVGARVVVAYTDAAGTSVYVKDSTDNGATFGAAVLAAGVAPSAITSLAIAMKSTTNSDCLLVFTESTGNILKVKPRAAGAWGATVTSPATFGGLSGTGAVYDGDYCLLITGTEITTLKPTLWSYAYGDGAFLGAGVWGTLNIQQQAENGGGTSYLAPYITFTDVHRISFVQFESFTGGQTRVFRAALHPLQPFVSGAYTWRTPTPSTYTDANGAALAAIIGATTGFLYESGVATVKRANLALVSLDLSDDVLSIDVHESTDDGRAELLLNNDAGQYTGPPAPLVLGNAVEIAFGYYTTAGDQASQLQTFWIRGMEHRVDGRGHSQLLLRLESGFGLLARNIQRTQISEAAATPSSIVGRILTRAGISGDGTGQSARAAALSIAFVITPATDGATALARVLALIADRVVMRAGVDALFTEPLVGDATDYAIGDDHPVRSFRYLQRAAPISEAFAHGAGATGQATDQTLAEQNLSPIGNIRDITSAAAGTAAATATAHLRQRKLDERDGELVIQPHVGLEPLDIITIDQPLVSAATIAARVMAIHWQYDKRRNILDQTLTLGPR